MTKTMKQLFGIVLMLMVSMVTNAQETNGEEPQVANEQTPQVKVDISEPFTGGEVKASVGDPSEEGGSVVVTLTVTPEEGYYITKQDLVVVATYMKPQKQEAETRADGDAEQKPAVLGGPLELTGDDPEDLTSERLYQFTLQQGLGAWVQEANFHSTAYVIGSDVTEIADHSLAGASSITIENDKEVIALGDNDVTGKTVVVPANLFNMYQMTEGWKEANIETKDAVKMEGVQFVEDKNQYDVYAAEQDLMVPFGVQAYDVTGIQGNRILLDEVKTLFKGKVVLLYSKEIKTTDLRTAAAPELSKTRADEGAEAPVVKCALKVVEYDPEKKAEDQGKEVRLGEVYLLYNDVFYLSQAGVIPVGGIYLELAKDEQMRARTFLTIGGDEGDGTTAIDAPLSTFHSPLSTFHSWHDLSGRRLSTMPTRKGLYIFNGKLVVIR